ncbi:UNVERIFIED_CONTAM: hypothetical protein GTU68_001632 [Idotea baltica]|nr:hypothetical protein [Idotea baltica]
MSIKKLLIANRGEIACRIMATCDALGIETVAVYSDADARAKHVRSAGETVHIGAAPAPESYLGGARIIEAAQATGADAIHPGYGFLSENADFADDVLKAGLIWVGPKPDTIRAMGLKDEAKRIAEDAGVPVLPGYRGEAQDLKTLAAAAKEVGFPLLIKAIAGGGGRGIRLVTKAGELKAELESAVREAESAFGDGRVMLEKLVEQPRHIEVQVFGDAHGNAVHMFERDCSLQRRRQKVIEEAPAPGMPDGVRIAMTDAAVKLAKSVGYEGAGTVEFIVDGAKPLALDTFWFLEMNTRLQVEHPVTERVTGLDLVALQLSVAAGEKLPMKQTDITLSGHAIEARICAEDPSEDYLPGAGLIEEFGLLQPIDGEMLRWDAGFESGDRVPPSYDSLIAKLIAHGEDRAAALTLLTDTLTHTQLVGVPGNVGFLLRCASSDAFEAGTHHVNWIAEQGETLTAPPDEHELSAALAVADILLSDDQSAGPWARRDGWRSNAVPRTSAAVAINGTVDVLEPDAWSLPDEIPLPLVTDLSPRRFAVTAGGDSFCVTVPDYDAEVEALLGGDSIKAPMPGKVIAVNVKTGDAVKAGDVMVVMEAMKMEHALGAPRDGVVESVTVQIGDQVADSAVFVTLVPED